MTDGDDEGARLLARVLNLAERGEAAALERLCRSERAAIVAAFPGWQRPSAELRADPAAMQRFAHGLFAAARVFHEALGDPSLLERNQTAKTFQPVPIVAGSSQPVKLVLKHKDYEELTLEKDLLPGPQTIRVTMVPRNP